MVQRSEKPTRVNKKLPTCFPAQNNLNIFYIKKNANSFNVHLMEHLNEIFVGNWCKLEF